MLDIDPIEYVKGIKTDHEIYGMRECQIRDGAALVKYFAWLENELVKKGCTNLTEWDAAAQSAKFRSQQE